MARALWSACEVFPVGLEMPSGDRSRPSGSFTFPDQGALERWLEDVAPAEHRRASDVPGRYEVGSSGQSVAVDGLVVVVNGAGLMYRALGGGVSSYGLEVGDWDGPRVRALREAARDAALVSQALVDLLSPDRAAPAFPDWWRDVDARGRTARRALARLSAICRDGARGAE